MAGSLSIDGPSSSPPLKQGGWITFPFFIATMAGLTVAGGWGSNLIVYLIREFNFKSIDAAQIGNIFNGCTSFFPILGAIIADSFLGSFNVICISSLVSLLGVVLLTLTATLDSLKPPLCETGSSLCTPPSKPQLAILYTSLVLSSMGLGGTRFTLAAMGADQFDDPKHQGVFFNWHFFTLYAGTLVSVVGIIYVEENVSWGLGYGLCVAANVVGLAVFLLGKRYYRLVKPQGSPFTGLACVGVAAFRNRKALLSLKSEDYYHEPQAGGITAPTNSFKFLNRAALIIEGDTNLDDSIARRPWKLCTLQQVEDLKTLIRILPLWSTGILLSTPIAVQISLIVLEALAMDRHLGLKFEVPAGSMAVFPMISTSLSLVLIDRFLFPMWQKLVGKSPTIFQRIGCGHALTVLSMVISALAESKRLNTARSHKLNGNSVVPMSAFWLVPEIVIVSIGEAFHFPGQVSLYFQEFPKSLKSTATAAVAMFIGIAFYLGTAVIDFLRKRTEWLPDGINDGRIDNVYWVLAAVALANFGYYLVCAWLYKYQNIEKVELNGSNPY